MFSIVIYEKIKMLISMSSQKHAYMILTPLNPTFIQQNWGFTGVYIIFLISAQKHRYVGTR